MLERCLPDFIAVKRDQVLSDREHVVLFRLDAAISCDSKDYMVSFLYQDEVQPDFHLTMVTEARSTIMFNLV